MSQNVRSGRQASTLPNHVILMLLMLFQLGPLVILGFNSLKTPADIGRNPLGPPTEFIWENYPRAWDVGNFATTTRNSGILVMGTVVGVLALGGLAAYSLAKLNAPGTLNAIMQSLAESIEGGSTLSESLAQHPKVFNPLYINMVKAGEVGGVLEVVLKRLADFMEKSQKIKGKIIASSFYPVAVLVVACAIMGLLLALVVPKFAEVFQGLTNGQPLPTFTLFVFGISEFVTRHIVLALSSVVALVIAAQVAIRTPPGRHFFDRLKLNMPVFGQIVRKLAITRFTRTFGTLASSGVPILQSLTIVKETAGNVIVRDAVAAIHDSIKQGETIAAPMRVSGVFPALVAGMVEIGEQTGALPEMLMKIADTYEEEVDNAVTAMTSLLEPIMIVFLAVLVGSIVIALFLPIIHLIDFDPARGVDP